MEDRPFTDKKIKPAAENLEPALKNTFPFYNDLLDLTKKFKHEWNYSKTGGWMEKVYGSKKALYYLIPMHKSFKVSLTVREKEKEAMINDKKMQLYHPLLNEAKKYSEGYNLQFIIENREQFVFFTGFIKELILSWR